MAILNVLILTGFGINCEEETAFAFNLAGAKSRIMHVNDLSANKLLFKKYQILVLPGGFSFGDDTGAGKALANFLKLTLGEMLSAFIQRDTLTLGVCNGFQVLVALGLVPALYGSYGLVQAALMPNDSARYITRWVDVEIRGTSPWLRHYSALSLPIAHGEGKFYADDEIVNQLEKRQLIALRYKKGEICKHFNLAVNPNGALNDIAGITDESGRILGLMPHPERAIRFTQLPHWPYLKEILQRAEKKVPENGPGLQLFKNAINYFL